MNYSQKDFEGMQLNPFGVPSGVKIFNHYNLLKMSRIIGMIPDDINKQAHYAAFSPTDLDILLRFIIAMYDTESPLYGISNLEDKKQYAIDLFKRKYPMDNHTEFWAEVSSEGELFEQKVYEFFVLINEHDYEHWISLKIQIHRFNKELRSPFKVAKDGTITKNLNARRAISKEINALKAQLDAVEIRLFPDNKRLSKKMAAVSMSNSIGGFAEKYAMKGPWVTN